MRHTHHSQIYRSKAHLMATLVIILLPFLFLLFFSDLAHISATKLFSDVLISVSRLAIAYVIAVLLAWALAVVFYQGRAALVALPLFDVFQGFPTFAILPIINFFFTPSNGTIILFLTLTVIWPILFSIISALKLIKHDWIEAVTISRVGGFAYFRLFLWPASIPGVITGSIIGLGDGWGALVATEIIIGARRGLGSFFLKFSTNPTITAFGVFGLLIIIFSINKLIWLPLLEWSHHTTEE